MDKLFRGAVVAAMTTVVASDASAVEWEVSLWGERRASTEHVHKLAELVAEKTGGDFTLDIHYGDLSRSTENLDGLALGAFEMAQFCVGYHADKNPALTVLELPFLGIADIREDMAVSNAVYEHPAAQQDMARWKARILMSSPVPQYNLAGKGDPRDSLESIRGMRVRAPGALGKVFEAIGAVPTAITAAETYTALEKGVVETVAFAPDAHLSYRTLELADWWTENLDLGTVNCPVAISLEAYEALSPEHRVALDGSVDAALEHYLANYDDLLARWDDVLEEHDVRRVSVPESELEMLREAGASVRTQWIETMRTQGVPAEELYGLVQRTLAAERRDD